MNKHRQWYDQIMERARRRVLETDFERHHVLPKSLGGGDEVENIVRLTYREHFLAHWLLTKFTSDSDRKKMLYALASMAFMGRGLRIRSSWQYDVSRRAVILARTGSKNPKHSQTVMGSNNPFFGRRHSKSHLKKLHGNTYAGKLTKKQIEKIRSSTGSSYKICKEFGVCSKTIRNVRTGMCYAKT